MNTPTHKKILYIITKSTFGGAQRYVFDLAVSASSQGYTPVVAAGGNGSFFKKLTQVGVKTITIKSLNRDVNIMRDLNTLKELYRLIKKEKPDIVHLNSSKVGLVGSIAARAAGVPHIIFTAHGWAFNEERSWYSRKFIKLLQWLTVFLSHKSIAVSQKTKLDISHLPFMEKNITVIRNGIENFTPIPKEKSRHLLAPFIHERIWIGTIAELHKNKGIDILLHSFSKIAEKHKNIALVIIGDGEEQENLTNLAKTLKMTDKVYFLGLVPQAREYVTAFDIFILPSRTEALPYVLLEAGSTAVPIIASRVGGIPEIIEHNKTGILTKPGNAESLHSAILSLHTNPQLAKKLGTNVQKKIVKEFNIESMIEQTISLYR